MCPDTDKTLKKANGASRPGAFGVSERAASAHSSRPEASPWAQLPSGLTPAARFAPPTPLRVLRPSKVSELKHSSYNFVIKSISLLSPWMDAGGGGAGVLILLLIKFLGGSA